MYNKLLRKILINKKYFFFKSLCLRKKERMHVDSLHDAYDFLQSVICRIKVKSIGRLYVIDDEFFRGINPERLACYSGDNNFQRRNTFFFHPTFSGEHRYRAKPAPSSERNRARRVITRKYGLSRPGADPSHMIDGKAKPLNAPNYLVNRAKCTRARAHNEWQMRGLLDIDVSVETEPRFHAVRYPRWDER